MIKTIRKPLISFSFFLFCFYSLFSASTNYFGSKELNNPYYYFLTPSDFSYIYALPSEKSGGLSMEFAGMIKDRKFKEAEIYLKSKSTQPYYALNLIILYLYFNKKEYLPYFKAWQKSCNFQDKKRFIDLLIFRHLDAASNLLKDKWENHSLGFYANFRYFEQKGDIKSIYQALYQWKNLKDENKEGQNLYESTINSWNLYKKNQIPANDNFKADNQIKNNDKDGNTMPEGNTREEITRYLLYLRDKKEWEEMKTFIKEEKSLKPEEKSIILNNISDWEKNEEEKNINMPPVKAKIRKN